MSNPLFFLFTRIRERKTTGIGDLVPGLVFWLLILIAAIVVIYYSCTGVI